MDSENKKIVRVSFAIFCLLVGYVLERSFAYIANTAGFRNIELLNIFPMSVVLAVVVAVAVYIWLLTHKRFFGFNTEVVAELKKVVWPGKNETVMSTLMVLVLVLITATLLWVFDLFWSFLLKQIIV